MRSLLLSFILLIISTNAFSQSREVQGLITDTETGLPIPYATIQLINSFSGTAANDVGEFTFSVGLAADSLKISSIGYGSKTLKIEEFMDITLEPKNTVLDTVVVTGLDLNPKKIVKKAFRSIRQNYISEPFKMKTFYRHYCSDSGRYGRLIEAAVDVYKPKGYTKPKSIKKRREDYRLTQLRRSLDRSEVRKTHKSIVFKEVIETDLVSYQVGPSGTDFDFSIMMASPILKLRRGIRYFDLQLEGITTFDNRDVYIIDYQSNADSTISEGGMLFVTNQRGKLYIDTQNHAFIKVTSENNLINQNKDEIYYKTNGSKYYLSHIIHNQYVPRNGHKAHIELLVNDIVPGEDKDFVHQPILGKALAIAKYDKQFWDNYNIIKQNPIERKIIADLEKGYSMEAQYDSMSRADRIAWDIVDNSEKSFYELLENKNQELIYIDFWATWCGPCISQFIRAGDKVEEYRNKGVRFIYFNLDEDIEKWKKVKTRYGLDKGEHFWLSNQSTVARDYYVSSIPRYMLVAPDGKLIEHAPKPTSEEFNMLLDRYLKKQLKDQDGLE